MSTWSKTRAKLEKDYLAPSLRGRIQYFATTYSKCPDHEGRAAVRLDGKEVLNSGYFELCRSRWNAQKNIKHNYPKLSCYECYTLAYQEALDGGDFDQRDFYTAFQEFDNQSIEKSLLSSNPIVRMFALFDRRLGKRRLVALKSSMESELDWLRPFYDLRLEAEGLLSKEK